MSDGGEAKSKRRKTNNRVISDEYGRAVSKIAVAQICESVGFESCIESALESFSDVAVRYLQELGKTARFYANLAGRNECNVFDIIQGLEDLCSSTGFSGASEVSDTFSSSGAVKEIIEYVESAEEIPIAQPVSHFPVIRNSKNTPSFDQMGESPPFKHVPAWLPAFPDPHTYNYSPMWNERVMDPRADKIELVRQRRKTENSLLSLQQRLLGNGSTATSSSSADDYKNDYKNENPFLGKPLQAGEKPVSQVVQPSNLKHVSLSEIFTSAIEAVKSGFNDLGDSAEKFVPDKRPAVQFNFKSCRKIVAESLDLTLKDKGSGKMTPWFGRDDDKDDKKRRAELILRQSMENQQDLNQL